MRKLLTALTVLLVLPLAGPEARQTQGQALLTSPPFESYLEALRVQAGIPGLSATILREGEVIWERGLGFQNQELRIRATPDTPYPIADLSQTLASVILLQCVEQRRLDIDAPATRYGVDLPEQNATLRNILNHSSAGTPGASFHYDIERYSQLTGAVESCVPQAYRKSVAVLLLERLAMKDSVPGRDLANPNILSEPIFAASVLDRYKRVLERLAIPYRVDKRGRLTRTELSPEGINAATGLVSTVRDLARFDLALDSALLLREETLAAAWTNAVSGDSLLPTGLGWFVQSYKGEPVVWHFGVIPNAYSSLIVKLPQRRLTLILLANSDGLNAPFQLNEGDINRSLFATLFLRLFT